MVNPFSLKLPVIIKSVKWNWQIICPKSHNDELPLYRRKENNFFKLCSFLLVHKVLL